MPTNLAALASDKPIPNGKVQIKRGVTALTVNYTTATAAGTKLSDGAGGFLQIGYTPTYPCLWVVKSNVMAHGFTDGTGWRRWDHGIYISPADADGRTLGHQCCHQLYDNVAVEWDTQAASAIFRLNAGVAYTAYLAHVYLTVGTAQFHTSVQMSRIVGKIVMEGEL